MDSNIEAAAVIVKELRHTNVYLAQIAQALKEISAKLPKNQEPPTAK